MPNTSTDAVTAERRRGRPRLDPDKRRRSEIYVRMPAALEVRLKRDAKRANRSMTKEIQVRLEESYLRDEIYGGSTMASMFRKMAEIALAIEKQHKDKSLFDDFRVFILIKAIWDDIIRQSIPRPDDDLLAEVCRGWDACRAGNRVTHEHKA